MDSTPPFFDPSTAETVAGLAPVVAYNPNGAVPVAGTGLMGQAFAPGTSIHNLSTLNGIIDGGATPEAEFEISEIGFYSKDSDTSLTEFLGDNGVVTSGDGSIEMGPSGLLIEGFVYIPPGPHEIAVNSDDGFQLKLGGQDIISFEGQRGLEETARVVDFDGGLYAIELRYFDAGSKMGLNMAIDGLPFDQSAFYKSQSDFENPAAGVATVPEDTYHPSQFLGAFIADGPDVINGGPGSQTIDGEGGDDEINGGDGDDILLGNYGDDKLVGGDGDDYFDGGYGSDLMIGG
ncbi:MAG: hypothetical protein AAF565_18490, partial [Pseudomonadota bacterium]